MASGPSGRGNVAGSKPFDFASDDILCSYEDYGNQDGNNGTHVDSSVSRDPSKEFHKSRMSRLSVFPASTYSPPEESSSSQEVIYAVENTVKKYTDNLMRFLEGISSRLSQLELYCYNVDKSIGEMRSDLNNDREESESRLKSLEKHVQEVHRSVQILRDKQELANTQQELAKLQLAQKDSSSASKPQQNEDRAIVTSSETTKLDVSTEPHDQRLALVPHQAAAPPPLPQQPAMQPPSTMPPQSMPHVQGYYMPPTKMTSPPQPAQAQYLPNQSQGQEFARMQGQSQINQSSQVQSVTPYQQQWSQQLQQAPQLSQQQMMQPQNVTSSQLMYPPYLPGQANSTPPDMAPGSIPMQVPFPGQPQPGSAGPKAMSYVYGNSGEQIQQLSAQQLKVGYAAQSGDGYMPNGQRPAHPPGNNFMIYSGEGGRATQYQQGPYPPQALQNPPRMATQNMVVPQSTRSHPYNELIEKLVNMGYRGNMLLASSGGWRRVVNQSTSTRYLTG